ncbi:helix-turn-helix domain-containing protein [Saccharopolyspora elongata]|uniref:helix-turn-helix domain-containing protein n=1 Tax=Saccharopolyspora elongata TaxID=2530387 RepID=UPI001F1CC07E|nr:helix-turn-helix domain-containing protein [Saccharopolyspora elongata]
MLTGRKYRLALTPAQADFAEHIGGICRAVWNIALEQRRAYRQRGRSSRPMRSARCCPCSRDYAPRPGRRRCAVRRACWRARSRRRGCTSCSSSCRG